MAAIETRLLVLGAVAIFEPVNGYQIRRELQSWDVDEWAHIRPGSIYSVLSTLARQGQLSRHDLVDGTREVAVYTTTDAGRLEMASLFESALRTVRLLDPVPLHTAISVMPLFERDTVLGHFEFRLAALDDTLARLRATHDLAVNGSVPPHVFAMLDLETEMLRVERESVERLIARVRAGELAFAGEPADWYPADDDPGLQMHRDRERYVELLHGTREQP